MHHQLASLCLGVLLLLPLLRALPPIGTPTPTPAPLPKYVQGTLTFVNCAPRAVSDVSVLFSPGGSVAASGSLSPTADNTIVLAYTKSYSSTTSVTTSLSPSATLPCNTMPTVLNPTPKGTWSPAQISVSHLPASGQNFAFLRGTPISLNLLALGLGSFLRGVTIHLNNIDRSNNSFKQGSTITIGNNTLTINIPEVQKSLDLDLGITSIHLGTADFYVQNFNVQSISIAASGNAFVMTMKFADTSRAIKGFLNAGNIDDLIPDFDIDNAVATATVTAITTTAGAGLTLQFSNVVLTADVQATGACSYLGFDVCDALFGTSGAITSAMQTAIGGALTSTTIQNALAGAIQTFLKSIGVTQNIASFGVYNGNLYYVLANSLAINPINLGPVSVGPVG